MLVRAEIERHRMAARALADWEAGDDTTLLLEAMAAREATDGGRHGP